MTRLARYLCAVGLVGLTASCGRVNYDGLFDDVFIVSTTEDRLAGPDTMESEDDLLDGALGLSLREAMVMANNTEDEDRIVFDEDIFSAEAAVAIALNSALPTVTGDNLIIDASERVVKLVASEETIVRIEADNVDVGGIDFLSANSISPVEVAGASNTVLRNNSYQSVASAINATDTNQLQILESDFSNVEADAITVATSTSLTIADNNFEDLLARALFVTESQAVTVERNTLLHVGGDQMTFSDSSRILVSENSIVIDNKTSQKGVRFEQVTDSDITNNFIDPGTAHLVSLVGSSRNTIFGNILDRGHAGVVLEGESMENMVRGNIIIGSEYDGVYVASSALDNTVVHNTIHNARSALVYGNETVISANNLISDDTAADFVGYVDVDAYDYRLAPGNAAFDAGEELGYDCLPDFDELYWDAAPDLGAVETRQQ